MKRKDSSAEKVVLMNGRSKDESCYSTFSDVGGHSSLNTSENNIFLLDNAETTDHNQVCNTCTKS